MKLTFGLLCRRLFSFQLKVKNLSFYNFLQCCSFTPLILSHNSHPPWDHHFSLSGLNHLLDKSKVCGETCTNKLWCSVFECTPWHKWANWTRSLFFCPNLALFLVFSSRLVVILVHYWENYLGLNRFGWFCLLISSNLVWVERVLLVFPQEKELRQREVRTTEE